MKQNGPTIILVVITFAGFLAATCKKEGETDAQRKEAITINYNKQINADSMKAVVTWLQGMGTRFALADNHRNVAVQIKKRFIRIGYNNCRLDSFMINKTFNNVIYRQWQYNVVASLPGSVYPDSVSIIGAHYDDYVGSGDPFSVAPGANDNASGVSAAIEIARVMKKNNYSPAGTIEFIAFGSEEMGLYGSYAYAGDARQRSRLIRLMLNNDMISYQPGTDQNTWIVNIIDYDNSHSLRKEAENMADRYTVLKHFNDNTYNKQSDSYPFFANGFKALFFISSIDPYYHTLNDKTDKFNYEYSREIAKICCSLLIDKN